MCIIPNPFSENNVADHADSGIPTPIHSAWSGLSPSSDQQPPDQVLAEIRKSMAVLFAEDQVVELRALRVDDYRRKNTQSGFFDEGHREDMAQEALRLTIMAEGVYFTLNPLNRALLSRRCNRVDVAGDGELATDNDVLQRRWLLI